MKYLPPLYSSDPDAHYIDGNPAAGQRGSYPPAAGFEAVLREIHHAIVVAGLTPSALDLTQLAQAILIIAQGGLSSGEGVKLDAHTASLNYPQLTAIDHFSLTDIVTVYSGGHHLRGTLQQLMDAMIPYLQSHLTFPTTTTTTPSGGNSAVASSVHNNTTNADATLGGTWVADASGFTFAFTTPQADTNYNVVVPSAGTTNGSIPITTQVATGGHWENASTHSNWITDYTTTTTYTYFTQTITYTKTTTGITITKNYNDGTNGGSAITHIKADFTATR